MEAIRDFATLRQRRAALHGSIALVPTMGALHAGHIALVERAKSIADHVIASIYVNPTQFGEAADLDRYPRDEAGDLAALEKAGCDLVWLPTNPVMYPPGDATMIEPAGPAFDWEGTARPGHFRGVATVVTKLFGQTMPTVALFGEKDWQQLQVIRRTTADLFLPVTILGVPTVREADGLAMSSRNRFLSEEERKKASLFPLTLRLVAKELGEGKTLSSVLDPAEAVLKAAGFGVDYLSVTEADTLRPVTHLQPDGVYRLLSTVRLGSVRLLDNIDIRLLPSH